MCCEKEIRGIKMMKNVRKCLLFLFVISIITATVGSAVAVLPTLGEVTLNPEYPTRLSTVTFTADVIGENINTVKIAVLECNATSGLCELNRDNVTMQLVGVSTYKATVTLNYPTASYLSYWFYVQNNSETIVLPNTQGMKVNLSINPINGNNGNNNGGDSPGFEVVVFIVAVCGMIILLGRKRFR